jgi:hypothetical protein
MQRADLEKVDGGTGWDCLSKTGNNKQQAEYMTKTKWIERRRPVLVDPPGRRARSEREGLFGGGRPLRPPISWHPETDQHACPYRRGGSSVTRPRSPFTRWNPCFLSSPGHHHGLTPFRVWKKIILNSVKHKRAILSRSFQRNKARIACSTKFRFLLFRENDSVCTDYRAELLRSDQRKRTQVNLHTKREEIIYLTNNHPSTHLQGNDDRPRKVNSPPSASSHLTNETNQAQQLLTEPGRSPEAWVSRSTWPCAQSGRGACRGRAPLQLAARVGRGAPSLSTTSAANRTRASAHLRRESRHSKKRENSRSQAGKKARVPEPNQWVSGGNART